jgi:hypothetical protein
MMGGTGSMTFGDIAPYVIGAAVIVVAVATFFLVRMFRRSS